MDASIHMPECSVAYNVAAGVGGRVCMHAWPLWECPQSGDGILSTLLLPFPRLFVPPISLPASQLVQPANGTVLYERREASI